MSIFSTTGPATLGQSANRRIPGVLLAVALAVGATQLGAWLPLVGAPVFGLLLGLIIAASGGVSRQQTDGIAFSSKYLLQTGVVLLGTGLGLSQVLAAGAQSLPVMLSTLAVCWLAAWGLGRWLGITADLTILIGAGTAICGASAIGAVAPVIEAREKDVAYAISTIFLFNLVAVGVFPPIGRVLQLSQRAFGLWAGTAINDTSSVVAAAFAYGRSAGEYATVIKLTRATMIVPLTLLLSVWQVIRGRGRAAATSRPPLRRLIPWFIVWFLAASVINSLGWISAPLAAGAGAAGRFLITAAMAGVGLAADLRQMTAAGVRPLLLGLLLWCTVALTSLGVQRLVG